MGDKGSKATEVGGAAAKALFDDLQLLGDVESKRMFGGYGLFLDGVMFAIINPAGQCFLRTDDTTAKRYDEAGSEWHGRMPYREIPATVLSKPDELVVWAQEAVDIAKTAKR